jgi:peptide/nickel transport system substrate-binding protein
MNQKTKSHSIFMRMFRVNRRTSLLLTLLVVLPLVLAACGPETPTPTPIAATATTAAPAADQPTATAATDEPTSPPATSAEDGIMTVSVQQQATWIRNFNPFSGDFRFPTINGMFEPLMIYNTVKGELVPWLGTDYEWSADNKKLTITLRDDVKWSDGEDFNADDVVFTFNLFKNTAGLQGPGGRQPNDCRVQLQAGLHPWPLRRRQPDDRT